MPQNTLFNFISDPTSNAATLFASGITLDRAINKKAHPYYRFGLTRDKDMMVSDDSRGYKLTEHHISVYQEEHRSIPELSQYHYTAHFIDNDGASYQLHVYFNGKDEIVSRPIFSRMGADGSPKRLSIDQLHEPFLDLALYYSRTVIRVVRENLNTKVTNLETIYKRLDQEIWGSSDKAVLREKINEICVVLQQLEALVRHDHYVKSRRFFMQMKAALLQDASVSADGACAATMVIEPASTSSLPEKCLVSLDTPATATASESASAHPDASISIVLDDKIDSLVSRFEILISLSATNPTLILNAFNSIPEEQHQSFVNELSGILTASYELILLLEEASSTASPIAINRLNKLHRDLHNVAESLVPRLLLHKKFALLDLLPAFHYLLTEQHLVMALLTKNKDILNYVLSHGDFVINSQPVVVKDRTYSSPVRYCCEQPSPDTALVECLAVLIQHNASILESDDEGLPLVYSILANEGHPLGAVLSRDDIFPKTLGLTTFQKQLKASLKRCLQNPALDPVKRASIETLIAQSDLKMGEIALFSRKSTRAVDMAVTAKIKQAAPEWPEERDPRVIRWRKELADAQHAFLSKLTKAEREREERESNKDKQAYLQLKAAFVLPDNPVFSEMRALFLCNYLELSVLLMQDRSQIYDIGKEIVSSRGRRSRELKAQLKSLEGQLQAHTLAMEECTGFKIFRDPSLITSHSPRLFAAAADTTGATDKHEEPATAPSRRDSP